MTEQSAREPEARTVHYRIYAYTTARPPLGEPHAVSLCPWGRGFAEELTGDLQLVTCPRCLHHMRELHMV